MNISLPKLSKNIDPLKEQSLFWYPCIIFISVFTTIFIYFSYGKTLSVKTLEQLWFVREEPQTLFQYILFLFNYFSDYGILFYFILIHSLIAFLFVYTFELCNIGRKTIFCLFILFNFSLEYNDIRLYVDPEFLFCIIWQLATVVFLRNYEHNYTRACIYWFIIMFISIFIHPIGFLWLIFFPISFIFFNFNRYFYKKQIVKILAIYYFVLLILVAIFYQHFIEFIYKSNDYFMVVNNRFTELLGNEFNISIGLFNSFVISGILSAFYVIIIAGGLILFAFYLSLVIKPSSILTSNARKFFIFNVLFFLFSSAFFMMYTGHLPKESFAILGVILILHLSSNGGYYIINRLYSKKIKADRLLIILWLFAAYALASMTKFGPNENMLREAGIYAKEQAKIIYSDHQIPLYYANKSPFENLLNLEYFNDADALFIHYENRHHKNLEILKNYKILKEFSNRHGDKAYVLKLK